MAYLRTPDAAQYLGIAPGTLENKRYNGTGPKFRKLGGRMVVYAAADLDDWASQDVHSSTSEPRSALAA
jgi:predicted DNA-binding transcriptional regulator AlpA